jgi:apolipoprotein N-acyltransferase
MKSKPDMTPHEKRIFLRYFLVYGLIFFWCVIEIIVSIFSTHVFSWNPILAGLIISVFFLRFFKKMVFRIKKELENTNKNEPKKK